MSEDPNEENLSNSKGTIHTEGGAYVAGSVNTSGGSFAGRDMMASEVTEDAIGFKKLENRPYILKKVTEKGIIFEDVYTAGGHFIGRDLIISDLKVEKIENKDAKPCEPPCVTPYQGLFSFDKGDWGRFFGRDVLTAQIASRLHDTNFLTVVGPSGSGKSSVIRAGVVPAILGWKTLADNVEPLPGSWKEIIITPTSRPLTKIAETLFPHDETAINELRTRLRTDDTALANILNALVSTDNHHRLIVVDQFEELFTLCNEADLRKAFVGNLLTIAQNPQPHLKIILALRADFYHRFLEDKQLAQLMLPGNQENVKQMDEEELTEAILQPAAQGGWKLQISLVNQILDDAGQEPGALPLLSHALLETWNNRGWDTMTFLGYRNAGGVKGAIARTANKTIDNLNKAEQLVARNLFLRLTKLGEGTLDTRRRVSFSEINSDATTQCVRQQLEQARLIVADEDGLEIAHEALIREWPLLKEWLNTDREGLIIHQRLREAAIRWQEKEKEPSYLHTGLRLAEAEQWAKIDGKDLSELESEFLAASLLAERRRKRNLRIAQISAGVISTILVMLIIGSLIINGERNNAVTARETAVAAQATSDVNAKIAENAQATSDINAEIANIESTRAIESQETAVAAKATSDVNAILAATSEADAKAAEYEVKLLKNAIQASQLALASEVELERDAELALLLSITGLGLSYQPDTQKNFYNTIYTHYRHKFNGHKDVVISITFDHIGTTVLTASGDNTAKLWDLQGNELVSFEGHTDSVTSAVFNPTDEKVLTSSADSTAKLWNLKGNELASLNGHTDWLNSAVFNPDGDMILTASRDNTAKLWDIQGNALISLIGHSESIISAIFNPTGDLILTSSGDNTAKLWDLQGNELLSFEGHTDWLNSAVFNPDGDMILTSSWDGTAKLWDLQGNELATVGHAASVTQAIFSPDGNTILTASWDNRAKLWDLQGNELASFDGHANSVTSAIFSPNGQKVLTTSWDDTAILWNLQGLELATFDGDTTSVTAAAFSPDGNTILTGSETSSGDGTVKLWELQQEEFITIDAHTDWISSATFNPIGDIILTAYGDGTVKLVDLKSNELVFINAHTDWIRVVAFNPTGELVLTVGEDNIVKLWDLLGNNITSFGHAASAISAIFSPDGEKILTNSRDDKARLWDLQGNELKSFEGHTHLITSITFNPTGDMILTASWDDTAKLWDLQGNELVSFEGHADKVTLATFNPAGDMILTASEDGTAKLWDLQGNELVSFEGHKNSVNSASFSPVGEFVLTSSLDNTAKLWDLNGNEIVFYEGNEDSITSAIFNPTGDMILTTDWNGTAKLWPFYPNLQSKIEVAKERISRGFTKAECTRFFSDDIENCPQTVDAVFALFEDELATP